MAAIGIDERANGERRAKVMLRILYRGPLSSCNYGCEYCPFAKKIDSRAELLDDAAKLRRFVDWVGERTAPTGVFFTPWGEALIRKSYQEALCELTRMPHVERAAIQTNLSCGLDWVDDCDPSRLGIWATFHPEWTDLDPFTAKVAALAARGVSISAGVVGFRRFEHQIAALRAALPASVYLWINAAKSSETYSPDDISRFTAIDPHFPTNTVAHASRGHNCQAGGDVISVDGDGDIRRCHFIRKVIGNIYDPSYAAALGPRPCTNPTCGCHIGYVHLERLRLRPVYGAGLLERVPR